MTVKVRARAVVELPSRTVVGVRTTCGPGVAPLSSIPPIAVPVPTVPFCGAESLTLKSSGLSSSRSSASVVTVIGVVGVGVGGRDGAHGRVSLKLPADQFAV